jgi:hypothetical protein
VEHCATGVVLSITSLRTVDFESSSEPRCCRVSKHRISIQSAERRPHRRLPAPRWFLVPGHAELLSDRIAVCHCAPTELVPNDTRLTFQPHSTHTTPCLKNHALPVGLEASSGAVVATLGRVEFDHPVPLSGTSPGRSGMHSSAPTERADRAERCDT